jgi:hypothetical protein
LALSDKFQKGAYTFEDFGILPHTAEETVHRFARLYRDGSFSDAPFEPLVKDYTFKGQD